MDAPVLAAFDPGTRRLGWCVGTGATLPLAGALTFEQAGEDLGLMAHMILGEVERLLDDTRPAFIAYEEPLLLPHDRKHNLRKTYATGVLIELAAHRRGIPVVEVTVKEVKRELAGNAYAEKHDMVSAARKVGIALPLTKEEGREDAADAFGAWLILLRHHNRQLSADYDRRIWSARGALL